MTEYQLDDVDKQLLNHLQENSRYTAIELADEVGVSDNTIHNRMARLEDAGIITGYTATVDHERAGLPLLFHFTCTARISERGTVADEIIRIPQVLEVTELMTGQENLQIKAVAGTDEDITRLAEKIDDLDLEINDENLVREDHSKSIDFVAVSDMIDEA